MTHPIDGLFRMALAVPGSMCTKALFCSTTVPQVCQLGSYLVLQACSATIRLADVLSYTAGLRGFVSFGGVEPF